LPSSGGTRFVALDLSERRVHLFDERGVGI
jgi:hypothetical protein